MTARRASGGRRLLLGSAVAPVVASVSALLIAATAAAVTRGPHVPPEGHASLSPHGPKLLWPPPRLHRPITIRLGRHVSFLRLSRHRDYVLRFPNGVKRGATIIKGGHDVVIRGGWTRLPARVRTNAERNAIYVKNTVGTVHIEGVLLQGSPRAAWDAIAVNAPRARVQVENVRVENVSAGPVGWHADVVQPWGGVRKIRIDRLTATSNNQGLQIPIALAPIGGADIRNVDVSYSRLPPAAGGVLVWLTKGLKSCRTYPVRLSNIYAMPKPGRPLGTSVWPSADAPLTCRAVVTGRSVSWPALPVHGSVRLGPPPHGQFVPRGAAGLGYRSPGFVGRHARR